MRIQLQSELAECGLACLAMIASHHGHDIGLFELRRRFPLSLKGARLADLVRVGNAMGFQARPVRLELEALGQLRMPCILHWDMNHFVVLREVRGGYARVVDPAFGDRRLPLSEVSERFSGVALELTPHDGFAPRAARPSISLRQLSGGISGLWPALVQLLALSVALQAVALIGPFFMQWVVDQVLVAADRGLLLVLAAGFGLLMLLQVTISMLRGWTVMYLSASVNQQWTANVFAHLIRLPLDFFEKRNIGDITSRLSSVQSIQRTLSTSFVEAIIDGLMASITLAMMIAYSPRLAAISAVAVAGYLLMRAVLYRSLREITERHMVASARQQTHLLESIRGMQSIKLAGAEGLRRSVYSNLVVDSVNLEYRVARNTLGFSGANQWLFGIERILVVTLGEMLAMDNLFSVGMLVAYLAYKDQFVMRSAALIDKWVDLRMLRLHAERLADVVLTEPEVAEAADIARPALMPVETAEASASLRIEVQDLSFRYGDGEPWILRHCSFTVDVGSAVALVGPSGCGKTTLVKLMLGLLPATEGRILVDGVDIRALGLEAYRRSVGAVMQEDSLFAGSIADNIAFFDPEADPASVVKAAEMAAIHDDIAAMPMGYHSLIGDMGSSLSGGQRQRLMLARALYRKPGLLFLDEATSHLDLRRERLVNEAVRALATTRVVVAHRPQTIAMCDRVLRLEGGGVVEAKAGDTENGDADSAFAPVGPASRPHSVTQPQES